MSRTASRRNGKIEFLRFVFCLCVMIFHGKNVMTDGVPHIMFSGRLGVEFFFLVSGFLMAASLAKIQQTQELGPPVSIGKQTVSFLWKKIKMLYPMVAIAFCMTMTISLCLKPLSFTESVEKILKGLPNLFLIDQTGIRFFTLNGTWYLSSMLIAMAILFPLCLKRYRFMRRVGAALIAFLLIGLLMQVTKGLAGTSVLFYGITFRGNIRAIAEIALGMLCYEGAMALRKVPLAKFGQILLNLLEIALYAVSILYMLFHKESKYDYFILIALAGAITISFSECSYCRRLWDLPVFGFLGKASLYIYLAHVSFARDLTFIVGENANNVVRMLVFIGLAFAATAFLWLTSIGWRKISGRLGSLIIRKPCRH